MQPQDPVRKVLEELSPDAPELIQKLVAGYDESGVDGIETAWKKGIEEIVNAD